MTHDDRPFTVKTCTLDHATVEARVYSLGSGQYRVTLHDEHGHTTPDRYGLVLYGPSRIYTLRPLTRQQWARLEPPRGFEVAPVVNERDTEAIVRTHFTKARPDGSDLAIEEQATAHPDLARAFRAASKSLSGNLGAPDFIIYDRVDPSFVIIVECKADIKHHSSPRYRQGQDSTVADIQKYAVDGVLHYATFAAKSANVIAVAVSGTSDDYKVATFRQLKGDISAEPLLNRDENPVERLCSLKEYADYFYHDPKAAARSLDQVLAFAKRIHNFMRDYAKLTEEEKPLVVSAILLALQYKPFLAGWRDADDKDLGGELMHALEQKISSAVVEPERQELMLAAYNFIKTHPELSRPVRIKIKGEAEMTTSPLRYMVDRIESEILAFTYTYEYVDLVGHFYAEFLRYTGGDGKGLGIVLTPRHLTELFVQLANVSIKDTVIDPCAGTGGFLISALAHMDRLSGDDPKVRERIRKTQLVGIEQQSKMYALGASNMILRGDGRSNLYRGSCFDPDVQDQVSSPTSGHGQPTRGLINPPYAQKGDKQHELDFVRTMMDMLTKGGTGVAVVPMSCALAPHPAKDALLQDHTLVAAISLPDELFYPVGVVTCALILRAHEPHNSTNPTWFGYWKDDGFSKTKHKGRRDVDGVWDEVRTEWLSDYHSRREIPGRCVQRSVGAQDEWCAEAYMDTDYSSATRATYAEIVRDFSLFTARQGLDYGERPTTPSRSTKRQSHLSTLVPVGDIFTVAYGQSLELNALPRTSGTTGVNFVSRTRANNGVSARILPPNTVKPSSPGTLTVALGGSVLETFLQPFPYVCGRDVAVLTPKQALSEQELLWFALCIRKNRYRFNYGRQANRTLAQLRIPDSAPLWVPRVAKESIESLARALLKSCEDWAL